MSECIYTGLQQARNGTQVPVFTTGRTLFSTYNPERDAENFITAHKEAFDKAGCIVIGGIGNGLHLQMLLERYPETKLIAFEADEDSLRFARESLSAPVSAATATAADSDGRLILTTADALKTVIPAHYLPALHGNFAFAAVRSWSDFLGERFSAIIPQINAIIGDVSADYSVQAQFGKLWHRNILVNLSLYESIDKDRLFDIQRFSVNSRKAAITGAGPTLEKTMHILKENRSEYCIFATDTTFSTLKDAGIIPDFVVTVDSQQISEKHFVGQNLDGTVLASDLAGNSSIIMHAAEQGAQILVFHNNHPLSLLLDFWLEEISRKDNPFPVIDSGAGTVLHAATDLARKLGFSDLEFFGADFAYSDGKAYTKGTYLEKQYYAEKDRTENAETAYNQIMYRAPLIKLSDTAYTTDVLSRYRKALESYLSEPCRKLPTADAKSGKSQQRTRDNASLTEFLPWYIEKLQKKDKKVLFSLLPLAAWYKKNFPDADTEHVYTFAEEQTANVGRIQCRLQKK